MKCKNSYKKHKEHEQQDIAKYLNLNKLFTATADRTLENNNSYDSINLNPVNSLRRI